MTVQEELAGVDAIYMPLINAATLDIVEYREELKQYSSKYNPFHALVRRGIYRNIESQRHFLQKIMADYQTAKKGAIANYKN